MIKKLSINEVYSAEKSYTQLSFVKNLIFWVDDLSSKKGCSNAIFVRPFKSNNFTPQNLTGEYFLLKTNFHGYGGKTYKCFYLNKKFYLIWIDKITNALWLQTFKENKIYDKSSNYLLSESVPRQLTTTLKGNFDSNFVIYKSSKLFGLMEKDNIDYLFSIELNKNLQGLKILREFNGFASSLDCNGDQTFLSWIEWDDDVMTWENNHLFFSEISNSGELNKIFKFKDKNINLSNSVSFFQPFWISSNILMCSEDSSGWWNLLFLEINQTGQVCIKRRIKKEFFEYGTPEWISGISRMSGSQTDLFCLVNNKGKCILEHYKNFTFYQKIDLPFTSFEDLHASSGKLICIASSDMSNKTLLEIDIDKDLDVFNDDKEKILGNLTLYSPAESFWFKGYNNEETHALIYRPRDGNGTPPPLILKAHGGPTLSFGGELNLEVQYWVSRGWCVAEVNYGGSSGFGRQYRERLNKRWGIVDSYDCILLAKSLIDLDLVDSSKVIISGSSAGGFTALNSLYQDNIFKAAICKYPVIDLNEMRLNTHRFEKNYLNSLIGNFKVRSNQYFDRSPKNNINKINKPILLFHGKKDEVVNFKQSLAFHKNLIQKNIYSKLFLFDEESHGFKNKINKLTVLSESEKFIQYIFSI